MLPSRYKLDRTTDAAAEPVTAAELRAHLRLDSTDQDTYLDTLIKTARNSLELETDRAFITQTLAMRLPAFWGAAIALPRAPLQSVSSVTYVDTDGASQTLSSSLYTVTTAGLRGELHTAYAQTLPATRGVPDAVTVTYVAGYGDAASDVPADVVHAVKLLAAHLFMNAEPVATHPGANAVAIPDTLRRLVAGFTARGAL